MRIIRPLDDMAAVTTSNAPDDAVATWEPEGRDLLKDKHDPWIEAVGDNLYYCDHGSLGKIDLATGMRKVITSLNWGSVMDFSISPNGSYAYISTQYSSAVNKVSFISTADGSVKSERYEQIGGFGVMLRRSSISWADDSSEAFYACGDLIIKITTGTWIESAIKRFAQGGIVSLLKNGSYIYYFNSSLLGPSTLYKLQLDGQVAVEKPVNYKIRKMIYNEERDEIIALTGNDIVSLLNKSTLDRITPPTPGGVGISAFGLDRCMRKYEGGFVVRSLSTSPVWKFYNLSDYSLDTSKTIPALPDRGEGIAIGTDYTVVQQNQGIALVDNTTRELVAQQNPNVVEGDTYIYNDKVYEVLTDNNDQPDEGAAKDPAPTWLDLGAINRLRMFDNKIDSVTRGNGSLNITIDAKQALNGIALFNVTAATVQITMTDATYGLVYDTGEVTMRDTSQIRGWYDWFFSARPEMRDLARIDLPTFPNAIVEVTLTGDNVSLGEIVIGRVQKIGETQYGGTSVGIIDSSIKERDPFGNFIIAERPFSKRVEFDVHVPTSGISGVQNILASYRAKPVVYVGAEGEEALVVFGFYRDFQINYTSYSIAASTITVEGL